MTSNSRVSRRLVLQAGAASTILGAPGLLLAQTAVLAPLAVYVLHGYLAQLSTELEEAATLEGASAWQVLGTVVLPVAAPGVAATALILFVLSWNQFLVPLVLTTSQVKTIPVAISDFFTFERELEWPTAAAALMVSLLPLAALVAVAYRVFPGDNDAPHYTVKDESDLTLLGYLVTGTEPLIEGCCVNSGGRALHLVWEHAVEDHPDGLYVHLGFNIDRKAAEVLSYEPYEGRREVRLHAARRVLIRLPDHAFRVIDKTALQRLPLLRKSGGVRRRKRRDVQSGDALLTFGEF